MKQEVVKQTRSLDSLFELIERLDRRVRQLESENGRLRKRLGMYEPEVLKPEPAEPAADGQASRTDYSLESEEKRRNRPAQQGRVSTEEKLNSAEPVEDLYLDKIPPKQCEFDSVRVAWRIENGQAAPIGYRLHRGPNGERATVPDMLYRREFPSTNNASEQIIRGAAQSGKLDRTRKSAHGCYRRPVITSVMESLRKNLETLTMESAIAVVKTWPKTRCSTFGTQPKHARRHHKLGFSPG